MIYVLADGGRLEATIRDAVGVGAPVRTLPLLPGTVIDERETAIVIVDGAADLGRALSAALDLDRTRPGTPVVLRAVPTPDVFDRAMQGGIRDVLAPDADAERIVHVVSQAFDIAHRRRRRMAKTPVGTHRMVMVVSSKGGAGKTTVASNLAVGLAHRAPGDVALADADLQFGDVANALGMKTPSHLRFAIEADVDDAEDLQGHLTRHRSGLVALCAPAVPALTDDISPTAYTKLLKLLADEYRYVVVDTDAGLSERTLAIMDDATDLVLVAATDVASIRGLTKTLDVLGSIGMTSARRHIVLNRSDAQVGIRLSEIAAAIGTAPDILLPSHRWMPMSMNMGVPILEQETDIPTIQPLWDLVGRILRP